MAKPDFNPFRDVLSGIIMAATSIPQLIAYAETVGYAGYRGLATAGPPLVAWGLVTGSPFMNSGVTSLTALMAKSDLDGESYVANHGEEKYVALVATYSLYVGVASILLAVLGFGKLATRVPKPVRSGFKWGCNVGVLISALPNGLFMFGARQLKLLFTESKLGEVILPWKSSFPGASNVGGFFFALTNPTHWGPEPALMFVLGTLFILKGKQFLPKALPPGTEVILVTALATWYSMRVGYAGSVVGEIPTIGEEAGIQIGPIRIPVELMDYRKLITEVPIADAFGGSSLRLLLSATIFAAVNFLSIMGIASGFESEDGISWSAERELVAQGASCFGAAMVGSAPVSGSMSRSLVARMTGATSQLACIVTALCWIYLQPHMSIMSPTPKAALSAVIVSAVIKGIAHPKDLLGLKGMNSVIGWLTGVATTCTSPTQGFAIGFAAFMVVSLVFPAKEKKQ